jgi:hypothetical protein
MRREIAGFAISPQIDWGWFGSMKGAGFFKQIVNNSPVGFSRGLDHIPAEGEVRREHYKAYVTHYLGAFPKQGGQPHGHGLATATRLLAMKRPDYFVCLDSANRMALSRALGINLGNHHYAGYWDLIIARLPDARWWNSPRPSDEDERMVWEGRSAFLDALFFEPLR